VAEKVKLPPGYLLTWGGQFENQQRAQTTLSIVVPVCLGLIFLLLFFSFGSIADAVLIILNVPFALVGGVFALWISGQFLSVPSAVGFIALFGVAVLNGVVMVSYFNHLLRAGRSLSDAVSEGAMLRLRPVLMTATVAALGLIPLLLATGTGSEVQKPLASVVVGGLVSSTLLTLVVLPVLYSWVAEIKQRRQRGMYDRESDLRRNNQLDEKVQ
jgi:cobalt-zinc-cadmium resistance protein CzcA